MAQAPLELEGTWEEIATHAPEFSGHRLSVTVLPERALIEAVPPRVGRDKAA